MGDLVTAIDGVKLGKQKLMQVLARRWHVVCAWRVRDVCMVSMVCAHSLCTWWMHVVKPMPPTMRMPCTCLVQVIKPQESHSFKVLRAKDSALGAAAKGGFFGFGRKKKNSLLMSEDQGETWGL